MPPQNEPSIPPGFSLARLNALIRDTITATGLDLSGMTVLTEAASGAYVVTPIIAALAGARHVYAVTRTTRYGSAAEIAQHTMALASLSGVADRITVSENVPTHVLPKVDIVTNSGHLRPITSAIIDALPAKAVVALMFEAWEFRSSDLDVSACLRRGIPVIGINERHASVDVFSYLGPLCVKLLHEAGLSVYRNRIAVVCDNGFDRSLVQGLSGLGARVELVSSVEALRPDSWDAIVISLTPAANLRIGPREVAHLASVSAPGTVIAQFWGDIDRDAINAANLRIWPPHSPGQGHMAILLSAIGPESIVRLQTGGLRAAEWIFHGGAVTPDGFAQPVDLNAFKS